MSSFICVVLWIQLACDIQLAYMAESSVGCFGVLLFATALGMFVVMGFPRPVWPLTKQTHHTDCMRKPKNYREREREIEWVMWNVSNFTFLGAQSYCEPYPRKINMFFFRKLVVFWWDCSTTDVEARAAAMFASTAAQWSATRAHHVKLVLRISWETPSNLTLYLFIDEANEVLRTRSILDG